jgi:hypothetical protein
MADSSAHVIEAPAQLVEACGGVTAVAKHFGLAVSTVGSWKARNSIPDDYRPGMVLLAAHKQVPGISYEWMTLVHANAVPQTAGVDQ